MPETDSATQNTPLAPSVEKAYYRKCIQLKRRLNEVEAANDEAKIRRLRLERGIMKMRLERAFLLDELRKRMEENVDNSEPSADEGMATPPPERPHRDKRRKQASVQDDAAGAGSAEQSSSHHHHHHHDHDHDHHHHHSRHSEGASSGRRRTSHAEGNAQDDEAGDTMDVEPPQDSRQRSRSSQFSRERTNGTGLEGGGGGEDVRGTNREAGATGEALSAGPAIHEGVNGQRRLAPSASGDSAEAGLL